MTTTTDNDQYAPPAGDELQAAKKAVQSFVSAFRTYALYPVEHASSRKNVAKLQEDLEAFLRDYPALRLDVAKNGFYYKGETLFEGTAEENNPAYLLTRDGLEFLEFERDLPLAETSALLCLLNRNRNPFEEPEGDIVTSLWQENFTHINYQEMDIFALESFQFDLSTFRMTPEQAADIVDSPHSQPPTSPQGAPAGTIESPAPEAPSILLPEQGVTIMPLTAKEKAELAAQIQAEEQKDFTSDVIDVLLIILVVQHNKVNFLHALEFLEFQFFETLDKGRFHLTYKLLNNILLVRNQLKEQKPWSPSLLDNFLLTLANEEKLGQVSWVKKPDMLRPHTPYLPQLLQILRLLPPQIIMTLGPLAARIPIDNLHVRNELLAIIDSKARLEPELLHSLLAKSGEEVNLLLAPLVVGMARQDAAGIYLEMTRHASAEVRKMGLDNYIQAATRPDFSELFPLLGDEDARVRERITAYLWQAGPDIAEPLLISFLEQACQNGHEDPKAIVDGYRALASYRTNGALPFLEKTLLDSRLTDMFNNSKTVHIKAAALALRTIGTDEAMAILKKGGQSMRPDIRLACQHVLRQ